MKKKKRKAARYWRSFVLREVPWSGEMLPLSLFRIRPFTVLLAMQARKSFDGFNFSHYSDHTSSGFLAQSSRWLSLGKI